MKRGSSPSKSHTHSIVELSHSSKLEMESPNGKRVAAESATADQIFIPEEIQNDILSRLPSKVLVRFSAVSKSWYSLFKSPNFITAHFNRSNSCYNAKLLILPAKIQRNRDNTCSLLSEETLIENHKFDFPWTRNPYKIVKFSNESCFSNGLICLSSFYRASHKLYLCNPSMRRVKTLPPSCVVTCPRRDGRNFYSVFGFAFDGASCDYKVVRIFYNALDGDMAPKAEFYSLKTDSWKSVELNVVQQVEKIYFSSASCNGGIHWFAAADFDQPSVILCFDLCEEVFSEMVLPVKLSIYKRGSVFLFKGLLSVFIETVNVDYLQYEVWVMKEYGVSESWIKQFTGMVPGVRKFEAGFTKGGKVILRKHDGILALLDLENSQLQDLAFNERLYRVSDYTESLVLLDDGVSSMSESDMPSHQTDEGRSCSSSSKEEANDAVWRAAINSSLATSSSNSFFWSNSTWRSQVPNF